MSDHSVVHVRENLEHAGQAHARHDPGLLAIGLFKLAKAIFFFSLGIGAVLFVALGAYVEKRTGGDPLAPIIGGGLAAALLWAQYVHAKNEGLKSAGPGTEST